MVGANNLSLLDMPDEILLRIISYLPRKDVFWIAGFTCKRLLAIACEINNVIEIAEETLLGDNEVKSRESRESERVDQLFQWKEISASLTHLIIPNETSWKVCNQIFQQISSQYWEEVGIVVIFKIRSPKTKQKLLKYIGDHCTSLQGFYITSYSGNEFSQLDEVIGKVSNKCRTLKELNLQGCYDITDEGI